MEDKLKDLISTKVNPILMTHNGFAELADLEIAENSLKIVLTFYGTCTSCPMSRSFTLKMIAEVLQEDFPNYQIKVENAEDAN